MTFIEEEEGNLIVSVPEHRYFRFEQCDAHAKVSPNGVSECDFAWTTDRGNLWLMELKDYGPNSQGELTEAVEALQTKLPKNITHAYLLVSAVWAGTGFGQALRDDIEMTFSNFPDDPRPTCAALVIRLENPQDTVLLLGLKDAIQGALSGLGLKAVLVLPALDSTLEDKIGIRIKSQSQ